MRYVQNPPFMERLTKHPSIRNKDGSISTHRMAAEEVKGQWYAFPMVIQQEDGSLKEHTDWKKAYEENRLKNNLMRFGKDKEAALSFAKGGYKKNTPLESSLLKMILGD